MPGNQAIAAEIAHHISTIDPLSSEITEIDCSKWTFVSEPNEVDMSNIAGKVNTTGEFYRKIGQCIKNELETIYANIADTFSINSESSYHLVDGDVAIREFSRRIILRKIRAKTPSGETLSPHYALFDLYREGWESSASAFML